MFNEFSVGADAPCVQGHFPGFPVVPGAWLLVKVEAALWQAFPDHRIESFGKVKFMGALKPGEQATIIGDDSTWPKVSVRVEGPAGSVLETMVLLRR